jgi:hypothetical protein
MVRVIYTGRIGDQDSIGRQLVSHRDVALAKSLD